MADFDGDEVNDLKLETSWVVSGRVFRFVMIVRRDVWEGLLAADESGTAKLTPGDAYERAKDFWHAVLQEIVDGEIARLDVKTAVDTHVSYPSLGWLEKRYPANNAAS